MFPFRMNASSRGIELLLLFLIACSPYKDLSVKGERSFEESSVKRIYGDEPERILYQTEIEVYGRYFTGLFVIKPIGEREYRAVFMSEMGVKFFELSFRKDVFELDHRFEKMDRSMVNTRIRKDLRLLLMPTIADQRTGTSF